MAESRKTSPDLLLIRFAAAVAAAGIAWLVVVGIGTACFFPPLAAQETPALGDVLGFASPMAIAGAVASIATLTLAGRGRWALAVAISVVALVVILIAAISICLWLDPGIARSRMGYWEFLRLRADAIRWASAAWRYFAPLGVAVGLVLGAISGLLIALARRRPRAAPWLALGALIACATGPVQQVALDLVFLWELTVRWHVVSPWLTDPSISASGAITGAVAGSVMAGLAVRARGFTPDLALQRTPATAAKCATYRLCAP